MTELFVGWWKIQKKSLCQMGGCLPTLSLWGIGEYCFPQEMAKAVLFRKRKLIAIHYLQ